MKGCKETAAVLEEVLQSFFKRRDVIACKQTQLRPFKSTVPSSYLADPSLKIALPRLSLHRASTVSLETSAPSSRSARYHSKSLIIDSRSRRAS